MKRGVGRFITGSVIMLFVCVCAAPNAFAQNGLGWSSLTLWDWGENNPRIWDGIYRWVTTNENCRKWADGTRERGLTEEKLWMVLEYVGEDGEYEEGVAQYCYQALFFTRNPLEGVFDPATLVGYGVLCPDWPPLDFGDGEDGESGYLQTHLIDGWMCKRVEIPQAEEGTCDLLQMKFQARLARNFKREKDLQTEPKWRALVKNTTIKGWAFALCGQSVGNFSDASFDATPDNAFLKCKIKWEAVFSNSLPSVDWVGEVYDKLQDLELSWPCEWYPYGFKASPIN